MAKPLAAKLGSAKAVLGVSDVLPGAEMGALAALHLHAYSRAIEG
jgi:hypothetical protein